MDIVRTPITLSDLQTMAESTFGELVKAVVDVERGIMAVDAELHSDEEAALLSDGSMQADLWGINLRPGLYPEEDWVEFDSLINLRPWQGNRSRGVEDEAVRRRILAIVDSLVVP